jgi:hypothetical protein
MKNGRLLSGKRTKRLDIRYFHVQDFLSRGIIKIDYCNTEDMIADFSLSLCFARKEIPDNERYCS